MSDRACETVDGRLGIFAEYGNDVRPSKVDGLPKPAYEKSRRHPGKLKIELISAVEDGLPTGGTIFSDVDSYSISSPDPFSHETKGTGLLFHGQPNCEPNIHDALQDSLVIHCSGLKYVGLRKLSRLLYQHHLPIESESLSLASLASWLPPDSDLRAAVESLLLPELNRLLNKSFVMTIISLQHWMYKEKRTAHSTLMEFMLLVLRVILMESPSCKVTLPDGDRKGRLWSIAREVESECILTTFQAGEDISKTSFQTISLECSDLFFLGVRKGITFDTSNVLARLDSRLLPYWRKG